MRTDELDYPLPRELIATHPVSPRDSARLLVVRRSAPSSIEHRRVRDLPELVGAGDRLVFNTTRVLPARLMGAIEQTGGKAEALYLSDDRADDGLGTEFAMVWRAMVKTKRARPGRRIELHDAMGAPSGVVLTLIERVSGDSGEWRVGVEVPGSLAGESTPGVLARVGRTALPPYILGARAAASDAGDDEADRSAYQTVFADAGFAGGEGLAGSPVSGSVAAPTAGLHMTPGLLERLSAVGVARSDVVLHVGAGTFKPIEVERVEDHPMHAEWCSLGASGGAALDKTPDGRGGRVIAVGTTSARTLESFAQVPAGERPEWLETRLLIAPGHGWRAVEGLLTNFHLPRSTLLAMVGALFPGGVADLLGVYEAAIAERYRFFSFGDAMLVLP